MVLFVACDNTSNHPLNNICSIMVTYIGEDNSCGVIIAQHFPLSQYLVIFALTKNRTMKLTEHQIDFILDMFFKSYESQYNGAMGIGRGLLTNGTAIVAGNESIFKGGIGNFIKTSNAEGLYHCLEYKIDLESFIGSHFFREALSATIEDLKRESASLIEKTNNLEKLYNE